MFHDFETHIDWRRTVCSMHYHGFHTHWSSGMKSGSKYLVSQRECQKCHRRSNMNLPFNYTNRLLIWKLTGFVPSPNLLSHQPFCYAYLLSQTDQTPKETDKAVITWPGPAKVLAVCASTDYILQSLQAGLQHTPLFPPPEPLLTKKCFIRSRSQESLWPYWQRHRRKATCI